MIIVRGLTFSYRREAELITGLDLDVGRGELVAVTGRSGCGKSTLLYLLGLLLRPNAGTITLDGRDVTALTDRQRSRVRAHDIGFVFQDAMLDTTRSVTDNVLEGHVYRRTRRATAHSRAVELLELLDVGIDARRKPGEISGGQAQRVALCRALLGEPTILLADEPTGNLDSASGTRVIEALRSEAANGRCVVLATHDPAVAGSADRLVGL